MRAQLPRLKHYANGKTNIYPKRNLNAASPRLPKKTFPQPKNKKFEISAQLC